MNTTKSESFASLFQNMEHAFEIPTYQRAYSWEEAEINQFLTDLSETTGTYYLGHYLFERKDESTLYVIDGQQRLTTCIIFFSSLVAELERRAAHGEAVVIDLKRIRETYIKAPHDSRQRLQTVDNDNNFFVDEIIERTECHTQEVDTKSKERIRKARLRFDKAFKSPELTSAELEKWGNLVAEASTTHLIVHDKVEAAQIFAFQNDRGKRLSDLELLKSYFMLQLLLSNAHSNQINADIKYVEREFSKIYTKMVAIKLSEDNVLAYYWRAISGKGYESPKVVAGVKDHLKKIDTPNKVIWIKDFVSGLAQAFAFVYSFEINPYQYAEDLRNLNNMALAYPILLKAYRARPSEKDLECLLRFLENVTFRSLLRGGRADIQSRLNQLLVGSITAESLRPRIARLVDDLKAGGWWWYWSDEAMRQCLESDFYQNRVDNYLLWKYEIFISNKHHPKPTLVAYQDLISNESIEHIAPKTPTNGEPEANGYGPYVDSVSPEEGIQSGGWLNCLGNLMLVSGSHNSRIGNHPFAEKLDSYGKDNLLMQQREIINFLADEKGVLSNKKVVRWDKAAIQARHKSMIAAANAIWNLDNILPD